MRLHYNFVITIYKIVEILLVKKWIILCSYKIDFKILKLYFIFRILMYMYI